MRPRRPRFALTLAAILAAAVVAVALTEPGPRSTPPTIGLEPSHACLATRALATVTARSAIVVTASAQAPVIVRVQASGPRGIATVQRSEVLTSRVRLSEPVVVQQTATAAGSGCGAGDSAQAAEAGALRRAYAQALAAAHARAARDAVVALRAALHRLYPAVLARARSLADRRARQLALAAQPSLAAGARAEAVRQAG